MFCPKCGHQQASEEIRFCTRCGLSLEAAAELLVDGDVQLRREKREVTGIGFTIATVLMLLNFFIVFGVVTLPHMVNPVFLVMWLIFLASALTTGGIGLTMLIRSGFFRKLKERERRLESMKDERRLASAADGATTPGLTARQVQELPGPRSVTEATTRSLNGER